MDYFVVRQSWDARKKLYQEICKGRLRQGWFFNDGLSLDQGEASSTASYASEADNPEEARSRYAILRPLRFRSAWRRSRRAEAT